VGIETVARCASPKAVVPVAWLTALVLHRRPGAARMAVGTSIAVLVAELVKRTVSRHRPRLLDSTPWRSFPSGHSAASTSYLIGLALVAPAAHRAAALGAAVVGAVAVNALRVLGREHWPTDVLAGDAVGIAGIAAAHMVIGESRRTPACTGSAS
jgi:membrane-associated phospholipid phosphatase